MAFSDRLRKIMINEQTNARQLSEKLGINPSAISFFLTEKREPSKNFLKSLCELFPYYNKDWILYGKEPIYSEQKSINSFNEFDNKNINEQNNNELSFNNNETSINTSTRNIDLFHTKKQDDNVMDNSYLAKNNSNTNPFIKENNDITKPTKQRKIVRITTFYDDNTFEDFYSK